MNKAKHCACDRPIVDDVELDLAVNWSIHGILRVLWKYFALTCSAAHGRASLAGINDRYFVPVRVCTCRIQWVTTTSSSVGLRSRPGPLWW